MNSHDATGEKYFAWCRKRQVRTRFINSELKEITYGNEKGKEKGENGFDKIITNKN